jgi:hypothetical protein
MDGSLVWSNQYNQSGTMMPSGAVHPIIASEAKQSIRKRAALWIASSQVLLAMTADGFLGGFSRGRRACQCCGNACTTN